MKCFSCNKEAMTCKETTYHYVESGLDDVYINGIELFTCPSCKEEIVNFPAVPELHSVIGLNIIRKKALLTGREIRFLRKNIGLKATAFAKIIAVDNATISRWESDSQNISASNDRLVRLVYASTKGFEKKIITDLITCSFNEIDPIKEHFKFNISLKDWCHNRKIVCT